MTDPRTHYQELVSVPLILRGPGIPRGRIVDEPISLADLVPTILALHDRVVPEGIDGVNLSGLWGDARPRPGSGRFLYAAADHNNEKPDIKRMVRCGGYKLCYDRLTGESELYDLVRDPRERVNRASEEPERLRLLMDRLEAFMASEETGERIEPPSGELLEQLRDLGYVR